MKAKYDPEGYQGTTWNGTTVTITDLTREELLHNLCMSMDAIERIEAQLENIQDLVDQWRDDTLKPKRSNK